MVILTYEVRMDGLPELAKETVALEIEESLRKIGWACFFFFFCTRVILDS